MLSLFEAPFAYAAEEVYTDYALLKDLKILNPKADVGGQLTAEDLARMAVVFNGHGNVIGEGGFETSAKEYGIMDESVSAPISLNTAAVVLMRSIYGGFCRGKSEQEIVKFASSQGLFKSLSVSNNSELILAEAAKLAENLLEMKTMDGTVGAEESYKFTNKTVLEDYFEITSKDGVLYTGQMLDMDDGYVTVDGVVYETAKNFADYGGYYVRAYIKEDEVISIDPTKFKNEIYMISANDIDGVDATGITFFKTKDKTVRIAIAADADEIYNGRLETFNYTDMNISNGFVTLIKHPNKSSYNVVVISQYDLMVAGGVGDNTIYGLNDTGMNVRINPANVETNVTLGGEKASIKEISKYDVLLISYTKKRDVVNIEIVRNVSSGNLVEESTDTVTVGRKTYIKTAYFKQYAKKPEFGSEVDIILDKAGFAVDFKPASGENRFGYFMGIYKTKQYQDEGYIRLMTSDGTIEKFKIQDKFVLNGKDVRYSDSETSEFTKAFKTLIELDVNGDRTERLVNDYVYQLIIYRVNSEGEINYIDTALEETDKDKDKQLTYDLYMDANKRYKSDAQQFVDSIGVSGTSTVMFRVPQTDNVFDANGDLDEAKRALADASKHYEIITPSYMTNDQTDVTASVYCVTPGGLAKAFVMYNKDLTAEEAFSATGQPLFVVTKISKGIDPEGEPCYILKGYEKAKEKTYYIKENDFGKDEGKSGAMEFVKPQVHDLMQMKADGAGIVLSYSTRYNGKTGKNYYQHIGNNVWSNFGCFSGYVYDSDEYGFVMVSDLDTRADERIVIAQSLNNVFVYDMKAKQMTLGSVQDLVPFKSVGYNASRIFVTSNYGAPRVVVVYVNEEE